MSNALTLEQIMALPYVTDAEARRLPTRGGLYCMVIDRSTLAYVGVTDRSLRARWYSHHRRRAARSLGDITIAFLHDGPVDDIERDTIAALAPPLNVRDVRPASRSARLAPPISQTTGGLDRSTQQWTPEQVAFLDAEARRLGLQSRAAVARMIVQAEIDRRATPRFDPVGGQP